MRHCPDSGRCPAAIAQPAPARPDFRLAARPDGTEHRAACALPAYLDPGTQRKLTELLDHWLWPQGLHHCLPPAERVRG